jgi:hypothetical protein
VYVALFPWALDGLSILVGQFAAGSAKVGQPEFLPGGLHRCTDGWPVVWLFFKAANLTLLYSLPLPDSGANRSGG